MSQAEVAREAARLIARHGLAKGKLRGPDGSLCLLGALYDYAEMVAPSRR